MKPMSMEESGETVPLKSADAQAPALPPPTSSPYSPVNSVGKTFGSTFFIVSTLIAAIIPALQLGFGVYYNGQCPIDQRIPSYMIVSGACGLALVALAVLLGLTFLCFISDSAALTVLASCGICINIAITALLSVFIFIWFIIGCVWVFSITNDVQFINPTTENYCNPVLYKWSFALIIVIFIWGFIQCCISCFRACCVGRGV